MNPAPTITPPLTSSQARCEKAWAMVQTQPTGTRRFAFTMQQIAQETGVSPRTVASMREFDGIIRSRGGRPTGNWNKDRRAAMARTRPR
ncbi:hypothetical protein [Paracoccus yeei]|uniref:hypothetical protein n=1 Tax=Paracoccus yeei TaxID=147645 RepID=UPI003BF83C0D